MKKLQKQTKKFFIKSTLLTTFIISLLLVVIKSYIPNEYQFIDPISLYWTLLSTVVFVYWFIIAPSVAEYKESEKLTVDIKSSLLNIENDLKYFSWLKDSFDFKWSLEVLKSMKNDFYFNVADNENRDFNLNIEKLNSYLLVGEKSWITANHIIRIKQEIWIVKKAYIRIIQIMEKDSLPQVIHNLKNFMTLFVIFILLFMNFWEWVVWFLHTVQESLMLFLISFFYIYLNFIINWLENPFDKRRFSWYIDLSFLKE